MLFNGFPKLINNQWLCYSVGHIMSTPKSMYLSPFYFMLHKDQIAWNCWNTRARWFNICSKWFNINLVKEVVVFFTGVFMGVSFSFIVWVDTSFIVRTQTFWTQKGVLQYPLDVNIPKRVTYNKVKLIVCIPQWMFMSQRLGKNFYVI